MPDTTGSLSQSTNTVKLVVLLLLVRSPEVSTRATDTTTPRLVVVTPGRDKTLFPCGDTVLKLSALEVGLLCRLVSKVGCYVFGAFLC
jgi:hypothetical protein